MALSKITIHRAGAVFSGRKDFIMTLKEFNEVNAETKTQRFNYCPNCGALMQDE